MIRSTLIATLFFTLAVIGCTNTSAESGGINQTASNTSEPSADDKPKAELKEGDAAPDFTLTADDGREVKLSDYKGKQTVVLYFYPKDETPGCTKQACAFRDSFADYKKAGIEVLGVSTDSVEDHQAFKKNQKLNFTLLADADKKVSKQYGVLATLGYARRVTFVIGKDGAIKKIYPKADPALNASEVLAFARTL